MKLNPLYFIGLVLLLALSGYVNIRQAKENKSAAEKLESLTDASSKQVTIIRRYLAPDSTKHVEYCTIYAKSNAEKKLAISAGYVDSLRQALDIKTGQLAEITRVKAVVADKVKTTVRDSAGHKQYAYQNKWLKIKLNAADSIAQYNYNLELVNTRYHTGSRLFGYTWHNDISVSDPNATIENIEAFRQPPIKPKRFGIGFQVGYYYDPICSCFRPAAGAGLSFNLIRI